MMPWRVGLVLTLGLLVGGCFLSAYQIASWTATGVSYVFSGKGVGDHALSLAMNQDCATWRVLKVKEICVDYGGDFENSWDAMASTWKIPDSEIEAGSGLTIVNADNTVDDPSVEPALTLIAVNTGDRAVFRRVGDSNAGPREPADDKLVRGVDFDGLVVPEWAVGTRRVFPWQHSAFASRGLDMDGLVRRERRKQNSKPTPLTVVGSDMSKPVIYLVMGSFRKKENAEKLGAEHTGIGTAVSKVVSDGRTMYRLLAGPIEKASLTSVRFNLAKADIRNSWAIRLCRGSFTIPPCKPVVEQAALP